MTKFRVLDLFSGIGGFSLGLERTGGFETAAFCEIEPYCQKVLAKHWPGVPIYDDIRELTADTLARDGIGVDVICGGFPCQDVSFAGKRAGLEGERSGLWREYARVIGELRPRFVIVENVPGLLNLGMGTVLGDMAALGYDATWDCVPASAVGAHHRRDRVWIVAHADCTTVRQQSKCESWRGGAAVIGTDCKAAHTSAMQRGKVERDEPHRNVSGVAEMADSDISGSQGRFRGELQECSREWTARTSSPSVAYANSSNGDWRGSDVQMGGQWGAEKAAEHGFTEGAQWSVEPDVGRVAHGVSSRVDRLRALGNAVVPQIPELIGRAILASVQEPAE